MKRICLYIILTILCFATALAQDAQDFTFLHLGKAEGLQSERIYTAVQSADGALWWASKEGVERYNGVNIKHYAIGDVKRFSHFGGCYYKLAKTARTWDVEQKTMPFIAFDNKGNIYVLNRKTDHFTPFIDLTSIVEGDVILNDVLATDKGLWLAMREGVWYLPVGDWTVLQDPGQAFAVARDCFANTFIQTRQGLLLCTRNGVLDYRQQPQEQPQRDMSLHALLPINVESGYYDDRYHNVWLGGYQDGVRIINADDNGQVPMHICKFQGNAANNPVRSICPYNDDIMLVGIDGAGVFKADRKSSNAGEFTATLLFDANEGPRGQLHGNGIYAMTCDTWGDIVVGSYSGGIDIARPVVTTPAIYTHERNNQQSLLNDRVNCVAQFGSGIMAMGTDNGISLLNSTTQQWTHTGKGLVVLSMCPTKRGTMLAATYGEGIYELSDDGRMQQAFHNGDGILKDDHVYKVFYDSDGHLWMGCLDGDLVEWSENRTTYYTVNNVQDILQLPNGNIAVATANGVKEIDPKKRQVKTLDYSAESEGDVSLFVNALFVNERQLWIATDGGGIYVYDTHTKRCSQLTTEHGLPSNTACAICKDSKGRLQIATDNGLALVSPQHTDHATNVNYCHGFERDFSPRAVATLHNGYLLYGSTNGAVVVNPEYVQAINYTAKLRLTDILYDSDDDLEWQEQTERMLAESHIDLPYRQRTFELQFESINLPYQHDIIYQYKVGDGQWSQPDAQQSIRFTNLEPGYHKLTLRCLSRTCGQVLDEMEVAITIGQPWWKSWWMWIFYLGLIALMFYGAWKTYQFHDKYMRLVVSHSSQVMQTIPADATDEQDEQPQDDGGSQEEDGPSEEAKADAPAAPKPKKDDNEGEAFIKQVTQLVVSNIERTDFTIDDLCREMAMSRTRFYLLLKSYTGKSPQDFIRVIRLERAAALLRSQHTVSEAAFMAGFDNPKYFSTVFKKYFGVSPSRYNPDA